MPRINEPDADFASSAKEAPLVGEHPQPSVTVPPPRGPLANVGPRAFLRGGSFRRCRGLRSRPQRSRSIAAPLAIAACTFLAFGTAAAKASLNVTSGTAEGTTLALPAGYGQYFYVG